MKSNAKSLALAGLVALCALWGGVAQAATPYANATLQGALTPGVYGTITFGNAPPPPVIYTQPVIIQRAPVFVQRPSVFARAARSCQKMVATLRKVLKEA